MTVRELIEKLQAFDPEAVIIMDGPDGGGYDVTHCLAVTMAEGTVDLVVPTTDEDYEKAKRMFPKIVSIGGDGHDHPDLWDVLRGWK